MNKKLSFDILDVMDSESIRDFHRQCGTVFYPMEQALLIYYSRNTSVDRKIEMWHELIDTFTEEEFQQVQFVTHNEKWKNKERLFYTLQNYEAALQRRFNRNESEQVFEARFWECAYKEEEHVEKGYFKNFEDALRFLREEKAELLEEDFLATREAEAEIVQVKLDESYKRDGDIYLYDNELQMIDICPAGMEEEKSLSSFYMRIPLPFKKGDIVKTIDTVPITYAVVNSDFEWDMKDDCERDGTDMHCYYDTFVETTGRYIFTSDALKYLYLEYASEEELPAEQKILILLSKTYQGELQIGDLLQYYSKYGEEAYFKGYVKKRIQE